jgi:hypothetical protein
MNPAGVGTKNDCADEDQQQFTISDPTRNEKTPVASPKHRYEVTIKETAKNPAGVRTKNDCADETSSNSPYPTLPGTRKHL